MPRAMMNVSLVLFPDPSAPARGAWLSLVTPAPPCGIDVDEVTSLATFCLRRASSENATLSVDARWTVQIEAARGAGYVSYVTVSFADVLAQSRDVDPDPLLAMWDGFSTVERLLRTPEVKRLTRAEQR